MITIPVEDWVFAVAALVGGVLLLVTVVFDDIIGGLLDGFGFDVGGTSITPILLGFIGMFGAGGLFATQVLDLHGAAAAIIGVVSGVGGAALAAVLFRTLRKTESDEPFKLADLVGDSAYVSVGIPANRYGSVLVKAEGQTHEFSATSDQDIAAGRTVTITGVAGTGVIVHEAATAGTTEGEAS
ncbi:MAG TPA: NfeD family protein [Candidatus Limnocylindrales bacterium]|jgi:membrane protein implicated in regulation of membrane protease activity|nr:NfeD family protein [Candidatus Limnocylindrales bacterium]